MSDVLPFFDARATLGLHVRARQMGSRLTPHSLEDLYEEMDLSGIGQAMVVDCMACECSPGDGNPRILEVTRNQPRLFPGWVGVPAGTDEFPSGQQLIDQMKTHGVGMIYLLPDFYRFTLDDWVVDDLVEPLAEHRAPVFLIYPGSDAIPFNEVVNLCRRHPNLPVILGNDRIRRQMRVCYKALEQCENLHLDVSCYWFHRGVEYLSQRFGSHRLIYASNWPRMNMAVTAMTVTTADLPLEDRKLISGDNLRRLLSWNVEARETPQLPEPADDLAKWAITGQKPQGLKVYDNHGHLGGRSGHYHVPDGSVELMLRDMDRYGIEQVCVFSLQGVFTDERYGNDLIFDAVNKYPDRFVGFTLVNPNRGHDFMMAELQRGMQAGMRGIKLIPTYQGYPEEGPNIDTPCQFAHDHRQIILNHYWGGPEQMDRRVRTYTNACFFTGHTTIGYKETMARYPNLYVCSCPVHTPYIVETVVEAVGADRFMFGSDLTDLPIAWGIASILVARISEREKLMIIRDNLKKVLTQYSLPVSRPAEVTA